MRIACHAQFLKTSEEHYANSVEMALAVRNVDDDTPNSRLIDPYDDDSLLHYLKYGQHINGIAQKQKRRVENIFQHFKLVDDTNILYRKDITDENYLKYPLRENRTELIQAAHSRQLQYKPILYLTT